MENLKYISKAKLKLKAKGYKLTSPRYEILQVICDIKKHVDANEIYKRVKSKNIGLSTVYRSTAIFEEVGIIRKIYASNVSYYEIEPVGEEKVHIHSKCINCNKIMDLKDEYVQASLKKFMNSLQSYDGISFEGISVILSVLCEKCKKRG